MIGYQPVTTDFALGGKTAIVTGGAAGIGLATAQFLADKGANLVIADLNKDAADIAKTIGSTHVGMSGDVTSAEYRARLFDLADDEFGGADILLIRPESWRWTKLKSSAKICGTGRFR